LFLSGFRASDFGFCHGGISRKDAKGAKTDEEKVDSEV
jgi:hypothetical protein